MKHNKQGTYHYWLDLYIYVYRVAHKIVDHFISLPTTCISHIYWKFLYSIYRVGQIKRGQCSFFCRI